MSYKLRRPDINLRPLTSLKVVRRAVSAMCVGIFVFYWVVGCGTGHPAEAVGSRAAARQALSRSRWPVRFVSTRDSQLLAGRVLLAHHSGFRFVVFFGQRNLSRTIAALPIAYRPLLRPDFGEASLLGEGPYIFVANAGRRGESAMRRRFEIAVQSQLETALCQASEMRSCPVI